MSEAHENCPQEDQNEKSEAKEVDVGSEPIALEAHGDIKTTNEESEEGTEKYEKKSKSTSENGGNDTHKSEPETSNTVHVAESGEPTTNQESNTNQEETSATPDATLTTTAEAITKEITQTINEITNKEEEEGTEGEGEEKKKALAATDKDNKTISIGTSPLSITETQEVSSTRNDDHQPSKSMRSGSRRGSYNSTRHGYAGGYQNYGLAYLPYKSNFEPSEDARRRADEFFKTLKL